jgi:hypothetical protein
VSISSRREARWSPERGAALAVTLIVIIALLAGGTLAMYLQLADSRSAQYVTESRGALFCAEAGLASARADVMSLSTQWGLILDGDDSNDPDGYPISGDLDGDGESDWTVTIRDNDDEQFPADNNTAIDTDATIFMVSTCTRYPDTPREVLELISFSGGGHNYLNVDKQGAGSTSNVNPRN